MLKKNRFLRTSRKSLFFQAQVFIGAVLDNGSCIYVFFFPPAFRGGPGNTRTAVRFGYGGYNGKIKDYGDGNGDYLPGTGNAYE
jgi:hypothetical protein